MLADPSSSVLLIIDLQEKLLPQIHESERVVSRAAQMIQGARLLGVPILATEQYPKGLGPTVESVRALLEPTPTYAKTAFGALGDPAVAGAVMGTHARTIYLIGVEAHVCIMQTALQALDMGLSVHVVVGAIGSRDPVQVSVGLRRMESTGATLVTSEMVLYEWLRDSTAPAFKGVLGLVK